MNIFKIPKTKLFEKKNSTVSSNQKFKFILFVQSLWIALLFVMAIWWWQLLLKQAARIAELEALSHTNTAEAHQQWLKTYHMLYWESGTFFALLLAISGVLFWVYWRDMKRTKSLQAFFASVTHELRTPLASIRLQTEAIADQVLSDEQLSESSSVYLTKLTERLLEDTGRLEAQVDRTLELSRLEGGGVVYSQPIRLKECIQRAVEVFPSNLKDKLKLDVKESQNLVFADPASIQVIFRNLFENSLKHSGKDLVKVQIYCEKNVDSKSWLLLRYKDFGNGFSGDEKKLGRLFFKSEKSNGAGVGLYLVKTLMQKMGGRAIFKNASGFEVDLWFKESL